MSDPTPDPITLTAVICDRCGASNLAALPAVIPDDASSVRVECPKCAAVAVLAERPVQDPQGPEVPDVIVVDAGDVTSLADQHL